MQWPGGSHIVLESTIEGVELLAIGYKYNKKNVLFFIATKGLDILNLVYLTLQNGKTVIQTL